MDKHSFNLQGGKGVALEAGFRSKDVVRDVIKRLYTKVMERELSDELDETKAVSVLRKTIQQRKQQKNLKLRKNYFLLLPDDAGSSLSDEKVQKKLKSLLPELAFIRLKSDSHEETFIVEDEDLMVAISEFFNTLEEHKPE
jgi:RNase P protein component